MTNYLFFLIIFLIPLPLAYAEVGKNFDTVQLPDGLTQWTSHYDRIWDGDSWENYLISDNPIQLEFESADISFLFDKVSCDFKLLEPESETIAINGYDFTLNIDGLPTILPICNLESFSQTEDKISFTINRGLFKTLYDMNPSGSMEWTHEIDNNEGKTSTFTIIETCTDCIVQSIDGNRIDFGSYTLDTKNDIHNTVKETRADKGDYVIEYEKIIQDKEKLIIDPTFSGNNPTLDAYLQDDDNDNICDAVPVAVSKQGLAGALLPVGRTINAAAFDCREAFFEWPIFSIPDASIISSVSFKFEIETQDGSGANCDYYELGNIPTSSASASWIWSALMNNNGSTALISNNALCNSAGNNKELNLGSSAITRLTAQLPNDRFVVGVRGTGNVGVASDASNHANWFASEDDNDPTPKPTLVVVYTSVDAVSDLTATDIRGTAVDLDWTQPTLNGGSISGYQINFTTPWSSNVASISKNFTNTTSATVIGLLGETQYSFRVGVWEQGGGGNFSGNVLNITTDFDPTGSFTPGTFNLTGTGTDVREIKYIRDDIDATSLFLNITADNDFELNCNFHYKFANINQTYTSIANTSINANEDMASFRFNNVTNEIIDVLCWDQYTNASARYLITITDFPLLQQIADFKAGEFGTLGMFGALDFISLIVVIFAMVGFNRVNETVGVVLGLFIVGGLAVLSNGLIISWATTFTAGFAVVIMWAIATTRKD